MSNVKAYFAGIRKEILANIEKATTDIVPTSFAKIHRTARDNQTKATAQIFYGENLSAKSNSKLGELTISGIPPLQAGKAELKFSISIDLQKNFRLELQCLVNGKIEKYFQNLEVFDILEEETI